MLGERSPNRKHYIYVKKPFLAVENVRTMSVLGAFWELETNILRMFPKQTGKVSLRQQDIHCLENVPLTLAIFSQNVPYMCFLF